MNSKWFDKKIPIEVTQYDIENGLHRQSTSCPIALAVCRALELKSQDLLVEVDDVISLPHYNVSVFDDCNIHRFINAYDKEEYVTPFNFNITIEPREPDYYGE